jgi:hypothetical protein
MLNPIEATMTEIIKKNSPGGVLVTTIPTTEPRDPMKRALIRVSTLTVLNRTPDSSVLPNNVGFIVPRCRAVLNLPE